MDIPLKFPKHWCPVCRFVVFAKKTGLDDWNSYIESYIQIFMKRSRKMKELLKRMGAIERMERGALCRMGGRPTTISSHGATDATRRATCRRRTWSRCGRISPGIGASSRSPRNTPTKSSAKHDANGTRSNRPEKERREFLDFQYPSKIQELSISVNTLDMPFKKCRLMGAPRS